MQKIKTACGPLNKAVMEIHDSGCDEYVLKAGGRLNAMEKSSTFFRLKLPYLIFSATEQLTITFKGR